MFRVATHGHFAHPARVMRRIVSRGEPGRLVGMYAVMRPNLHSPLGAHHRVSSRPTGADCSLAAVALGADHPLVAVLRASQRADDGLVAVGCVELAAVVLLFGGVPFAVSLALAAALVQIALVVRIAAIGANRRDVCRELIIGGREDLRLVAVEREVRRLRGRGGRAIARSIEKLADLGHRRRAQAGPGPPVWDVRVLAAVAPQLREIAGLLKADAPAIRGVALVDWLISDGQSPLYGRSVEPLREELGRARYLLLAQRC